MLVIGLVVLSSFLVVYTIVGYPVLLVVLSAVRSPNRNGRKSNPEGNWPSVTMIIAAHNEEAVIAEKLQNVQEIDYPGEFECLVVSDSSDSTDEIVRKTAPTSVTLLSLQERRGKSRALNSGVERASNDVIVFSDANTLYADDALRNLVPPLEKPDVGCVTGKLNLRNPDGETGEETYWRYELWLRRLESRLGTTVSVNGGMLAVRRTDFEFLPETTLVDDLAVALQQAADGRRIIFVEEAQAREWTVGELAEEYDRRIRISAGNFQLVERFWRLLTPWRGIIAFEFFSHKVLRWCMPLLLAVLFVATAGATALTVTPWVSVYLGIQTAGYVSGIVGLVSERGKSIAVVRYAAYFLAMNVAFAMGFVLYLQGTGTGVWNTTPRKN